MEPKVALQRALEHTSNVTSRAWLERYLHPPSGGGIEPEGPFVGIPDNESTPSVTAEFRSQQTVPAPVLEMGDDTWTCLVVPTNMEGTDCVVLTWSGALPSSAAAVNIVVLRDDGSGIGSYGSEHLAARKRMAYASLTGYLDVSDLYNQGMVYSAQVTPEVDQYPPGSDNISLRVRFGGLVTPAGIRQVSPKGGMRPAKEGDFIVQQAANPTISYVSQMAGRVHVEFALKSREGDVINLNKFFTDTGEMVDQPAQASENITNWYPNFTSGFQYWTGLLPQATITLKFVRGWEFLPKVDTPWSAFVTNAAPPENAVIDEAFAIRYQMTDSYPSSANDWGSLWSGVKEWLPTVGSLAKQALPAIKLAITNSGLPASGLLGKGIDMLESELAKPGVPKKSKNAKRNELRKIERDVGRMELVDEGVVNRAPLQQPKPQRPPRRLRRRKAQQTAL